jgi:hypothetical protein
MQKLDDRIRKALANGPLDSYALANLVWPQKTYAKAWRYQSNGGPPGWVLPLGKAIKRMNLQTWHKFNPRRKMVALAGA